MTTVMRMVGEIFGGGCFVSIVLIVTQALIKLARDKDKEICLPDKVSFRACMMISLVGIISYQGFEWESLYLLILIIYAAFMAYTDHYCSLLYTAYSMLMLVVGIVMLFITSSDYKKDMIALLSYVCVVAFGWLIRAYANGDLWLLIAIYPYMVRTVADIGKEELVVANSGGIRLLSADSTTWMLMFLCAVMILSVLSSIRIKPFGVIKIKPLAPVLAFAITLSVALL